MAVTPIGVATGIAIGAIGGSLVQLYRNWLDRKQTAKEWFQDSLGLIARVEHLGRRTTEYQPEVNTEKLRLDLEPLSEEIKEHAASAPDGVSQEARDRIDFLADISNGLVIIAEQGDDVAPTELLSLLQMFANQGETPEMEQVNQIISLIDTEEIYEHLPTEDMEYDEEKLDGIFAELSEETVKTMQIQSVEDALKFDFKEANEIVDGFDVVDEVIDDTMRQYIRVWMLNITEDIYDEMEERREYV